MAQLGCSSVSVLALLGMLGLWGCNREAPKAAAPPPAVTVAKPIAREVVDYNEYTGRLKAAEEVEVRARVKGYLESIGFKDGDEVTKDGDVVTKPHLLFQIDPKPFKATLDAAKGALEQVKARRITADADVRRYKELVPKGAAPAQDLDRAIGQLAEAEAGIQTATAQVEQAQLDLDYATITAPIDGLASRANYTVGNLIGAGGGDQVLTTIMKVDPIHVYFDVDQRSIQEYRNRALKQRAGATEPKTIRDLNIAFQFGLASEEGFPHEGILDFIDNTVDPATGTIVVRGAVENPKRLFRPGFSASVRVAASEKYKALLVAERAIGTQQGERYVLVVDAKDQVVFRPVQLGARQPGGLRAVTAGLKPDERIIVNGIQRARPGTTVTPEAGEMLPPQPSAETTQPVTLGE